MRILAIRGKNLASLYGDFEVRLDASPIADAGLFCISGPTGAGKSTILDALCLALYGKTPRTRDRGGALVGRSDEKDRLGANDPRALLSRGTGDGHAEVDFEGTGGTYRARWSIHRAGGKAGGKLQKAEMTLRELGSGRPIGEGLVGVQEELEKRVGYTFEEFCRAVLLPQFEFTNFLRAKPDDRAAILERVTGKELYTTLSVMAHERAARHKKDLEGLRLQRDATRVLDEAERVALDAEVARLEAEVVRIAGELDEARKAVAWHERAAALARELEEAEAALVAARTRELAAAPRRDELSATEAAQPLRPVRDDAVAAEGRAAAGRSEADRLAEEARNADEAAEGARVALAVAESAVVKARADAEAAAPEVERAKELDRALAGARERAASAEAEVRRAAAAVEESRAKVRAHEAEDARVRAARGEAEAWLVAHRDRLPLADGWSRWEAELDRHGQAVAALAGAEAGLAEARRAQAEVTAAHVKATEAERGHEDRERTAAAAAEAAEVAAGRVDRAALAARRDGLTGSLSSYAELARSAETATMATAALASARAQAEGARAFLATSAAERDRLAGERAVAEGRLVEARDGLQAIGQLGNYEEARGLLRAGDPCPLCGSIEHPWAHGAPVALLEERKARVAALEASYRELGDRLASLERDRAVTEARAERAAADAGRAEAELGQATAVYDRLARSHGISVAPGDAGPELARRKAEAEAAVVALKAQEAEADRLVAEAGKARKAADAARKALETARGTRLELERRVDEAAHRVERLDGDRSRLAGERDTAEAHLAPVLSFRAGWQDEARRDARGFRASCQTLVQAIGARRDAVARADRELAAEAQALEGARARLAEREGLLATTVTGRDAAVAHLEARLAERRGLLGGKATTDVERALRDAVEAADRARDLARTGAEAAGKRAAVARSVHAGAVARADASAREATAAAERLALALASAGLDRMALDHRLTRDPAWITEVRAELAGLAEAVNRAGTLRDERTRQTAAHEAQGKPALPPELARARREGGAAELAVAEKARDAVRFRRQADDDAHRHRADLEARHAAHEKEVAPWLTLADLIGSADGKKFRLFVQGLAFDLLLAGANEHLAELARRYRLARVPDTDLDMQVIDQDLGDEVRSLNGLSGGETFLVSLALALGLTTLSTKADHAKTLFIDEGFGTLDRDTLDHAMVALEGLQSAGRTVGVISHVPEMHERVGVRVEVERVAVGRSRVTVRGPG